jgi:hypothetical protein
VTYIEFVATCVALLVAALLVAFLLRFSVRPENDILRGHRVTVHTRQPDDQTLHGVLVRETADRLVLADAAYVTPHGKDPIPGETAVVFKSNVSWLQEHGDPRKEG